jgi:hypothetical protein
VPVKRFDIATQLCEPRTRQELIARGHTVAEFGQGLVSEDARKLLRAAHPPDLGRWPADFRVRTADGLDCYVDAKFHDGRNRNDSIEMRSVLAARLQSVTWFYACSVWDGEKFSGFKSINIRAMPLNKGCCPDCVGIFHSSADPVEVNKLLPDYCPVAKMQRGSGTPYFLVLAESFPYGDTLFGRKPPADQGDRKLHLPWCGKDHPPCQFTVGSLWCVNADCGNPHHLGPSSRQD